VADHCRLVRPEIAPVPQGLVDHDRVDQRDAGVSALLGAVQHVRLDREQLDRGPPPWCGDPDRDGLAVTKPSGELRQAVAGVVVETIANGDYGLIQVWGYRNGARCSGGSGLVTSKVSSGTVLVCKTAGFAVAAAHSTITVKPYHLFPVGHGIVPANTAAKATSATTWVGKVFVKCL